MSRLRVPLSRHVLPRHEQAGATGSTRESEREREPLVQCMSEGSIREGMIFKNLTLTPRTHDFGDDRLDMMSDCVRELILKCHTAANNLGTLR